MWLISVVLFLVFLTFNSNVCLAASDVEFKTLRRIKGVLVGVGPVVQFNTAGIVRVSGVYAFDLFQCLTVGEILRSFESASQDIQKQLR